MRVRRDLLAWFRLGFRLGFRLRLGLGLRLEATSWLRAQP